MNNEPVAWMQVHYKDGKPTKFSKVQTWEDDVPLYTHPAEHDLGIAEAIGFEKGYKAATAKTLTDEEIGDFTHRMVLCCQVHPSSADINVLGLKFIVEDILRKAQEK